ncbi:MAG: tRNA lysidine(34) synthetase TilS [Oscillatoria sp. PMC 1068.18]|nr:tRNA lysidine(34) synthetase TilS [Oscillatoria sp. PMC 1076.18]MEC4989134.1 tRNA lysidine(34) synthetase TilS [Oscillatoria sp. PMC 1068.18]
MTPSPSWTLLHARLHQTLRQRKLLPPQKRVLVAVSGGQDSLCLLKLLLDLQPKWFWDLAIAHCDHGWATDVGIATHVREIAATWQLPFYLQSTTQLQETEAAARHWRYQALSTIAREHEFTLVVTGHTQSDRAETLLYNLIRGTGADGLQALSWERDLAPQLSLVRPLLNFSRSETGEFCQQFALPVWEDAANQNQNYARNRLRSQVLPVLKAEFNPQVETAIAQTAELLRADVEYLEACAHNLFQQAQIPHQIGLNRACLRQAPLALQRRVMRQLLKQVLLRTPSYEQIEQLTQLIEAPNRSRTSSLPGGTIAEVENDSIIFRSICQ